jgi:hypothetical protein
MQGPLPDKTNHIRLFIGYCMARRSEIAKYGHLLAGG